MSSATSSLKAVTTVGRPASNQSSLHVADLLLPIGIALWGVGVSRINVTALGQYGLLGAMPVIFYVGLAVFVVSAATELARPLPSRWRMSLHAIALVVMLYGTAPLVYSEGRYSWLYKTIGVTQYVNAHGHLNHTIDIYQNWPGFFALSAWFGKVAGLASPLSYAKWAQLAVELAALPLLYLIYDSLSLTVRQRWVALLLFSASNWVGQDYFSPQAVGTLLSLGIMAMAMRWLYVARSPRHVEAQPGAVRPGASPPDAPGPDEWRWLGLTRHQLAICATVAVVYLVLTFTHELSPYIVLVQLGALAVFKLLRPRWLPLVLAAIAIVYLIPRFGFVNTRYGVLKSIGDFFSNATPPAFVNGNVTSSQRLIERSAEVLSAGMWLLAVAGIWLRRKSGRNIFGLALLAFTPVVVLALQAYGQEGILRVYLFSLPWTAALAAMALIPAMSDQGQPAAAATADLPTTSDGAATSTVGAATSAAGSATEPADALAPATAGRLTWKLVRAPVVLALAIALFLPAFFGDDAFNSMTKAEVTTVTNFLQTHSPGPIYAVIDNAPLSDTAAYNQFPITRIVGSYSLMKKRPITSSIASTLADHAAVLTHERSNAYLVLTPSMIAYNNAYRITPSSTFTILLTSLAHSSSWHLLLNQQGTIIYVWHPSHGLR